MSTLDDLLDVGDRQRDRTRDAARAVAGYVRVGLWSAGWLLAKTVFLALLAVGGVLYGVGWFAQRALWPALVWMGAAVRLGWEDGRKRAG